MSDVIRSSQSPPYPKSQRRKQVKREKGRKENKSKNKEQNQEKLPCSRPPVLLLVELQFYSNSLKQAAAPSSHLCGRIHMFRNDTAW
jgi:hypothetical protein